MKITDIGLQIVNQPIATGFQPNWGRGLKQDYLPVTVIRLETDEGITGYAGGPTSGREVLAGAEAFIKPALLGMDPFDTERITRILDNASLRMGWPWFVEAAVWDIIGKKTGQPLYRLLGGQTGKLPVYASTGEIRSPGNRLKDVEKFAEEGFRGIKLRFRPGKVNELLETIDKIREKCGDSMDIMVDANQADSLPGAVAMEDWGVHQARKLALQLAEYGVLWLEEPLSRFDYEGLGELAGNSPIPIAGGEKNQGLREFGDLLLRGCYHIVQPDCMFSGTISQVKKVAAIAEFCHRKLIPHTWSTGFGLFANVHLAASVPGCDWFEYPYDPPSWTHKLNFELFEKGLEIGEGYVVLPEEPGLGFRPDLEKIEHYTVEKI